MLPLWLSNWSRCPSVSTLATPLVQTSYRSSSPRFHKPPAHFSLWLKDTHIHAQQLLASICWCVNVGSVYHQKHSFAKAVASFLLSTSKVLVFFHKQDCKLSLEPSQGNLTPSFVYRFVPWLLLMIASQKTQVMQRLLTSLSCYEPAHCPCHHSSLLYQTHHTWPWKEAWKCQGFQGREDKRGMDALFGALSLGH